MDRSLRGRAGIGFKTKIEPENVECGECLIRSWTSSDRASRALTYEDYIVEIKYISSWRTESNESRILIY